MHWYAIYSSQRKLAYFLMVTSPIPSFLKINVQYSNEMTYVDALYNKRLFNIYIYFFENLKM